MKHIVLGATGSVGSLLVRCLASSGEQVIAVSRSLEEVRQHNVIYKKLDVLDTEHLAKTITPDSIVYYVVNSDFHRWEELSGKLDSAITACSNKNIKFVYLDNVYCYGRRSHKLTEDTASDATTKKGKLRANLCSRIWEAHDAGILSATIARSSDFYGVGVVNATLGKMVVDGLLAKGLASVPMNVQVPHCFNYIEDLVANLVTLAKSEIAWGDTWHLPCDHPISIQAWGQLFLKAAGKSGAINRMPGIVETLLGFAFPAIREYRELRYEYDNLVVFVDKKFRSNFDAVVTSHDQAIQQMIHILANENDVNSIGKNYQSLEGNI